MRIDNRMSCETHVQFRQENAKLTMRIGNQILCCEFLLDANVSQTIFRNGDPQNFKNPRKPRRCKLHRLAIDINQIRQRTRQLIISITSREQFLRPTLQSIMTQQPCSIDLQKISTCFGHAPHLQQSFTNIRTMRLRNRNHTSFLRTGGPIWCQSLQMQPKRN